EGIDRTAINEAIKILATAERPLIIFPEGGVTRTNDRLHALLDGVAFVARSAAKKRKSHTEGGKVVVHPVALKYLFQGDIYESLDPMLTDIEHRLSWRPQRDLSLMDRVTKVGLTLLTLKEIEHIGKPQSAEFVDRMSSLIDHLLDPLEQEWLGSKQDGGIISRVKAIRMKIMPEMVRGNLSEEEKERRWNQLANLYLSQQVASYPPDYLTSQLSVDRVFETVERYEEDLTDKVRPNPPIKVIIQVAPAITVSPKRDRSAEGDALMTEIATSLQGMLDNLAQLSPTLKTS
ncbi:MAG: 1-acyl-sn-glycerol-3-phosphate acyltransferase, partial [Planctomycetota bacterium]